MTQGDGRMAALRGFARSHEAVREMRLGMLVSDRALRYE
jgi:hypothetical protein